MAVPGRAKLLVALALLAVLGAAAAAVALKTLFPEPKLRAMLVDGARRQLGREIRLERVVVGLRGLYLDGLSVSESPDFEAGTFLSVERFLLRPSWKGLLRRRLVIARLEADGLEVSVLRGAGGAYNFSTLASSAPASPAPAAAPAAAGRPELSIRHVRVSRGALRYRDEAAGEAWSLSELSLAVEDFGMAEPFGLRVSLRAQGEREGRPVDAKIAFEGRVDPARGELERVKLRAKRLSLVAQGLLLEGSGELEGLPPRRAAFDASLGSLGKTLLEAEGTVRLSTAAGGDLAADVTARTRGLDTTRLAALLPSAGIPALNLPAATLRLQGERRGAEAEIRSFLLEWAEGKAEGRLKASGLGSESPRYAGRVALAASLPALSPGQYPFLKLPPKLALPASRVDGVVELEGDAARVESLVLSVPQGKATLSGAVKRLGSAKPVPDLELALALSLPPARVSDLPVEAPASLRPGFVIPATRVDGRVALDGSDLRPRGLVLGFPAGRLTLDGVVRGALDGAPRPQLTAKGELALPALAEKDLPMAGLPPGTRLPPSSWKWELEYSPSRLRLRGLELKSGGSELALDGAVDDPAGRRSYDLLLKCKSLVLEELAELAPAARGLELKGGGYLAASITGRGDAPVFAGKAQFRGVGAVVAGLPLEDFAGAVSFDERRVDLPGLKGRVGDGALAMDLTIKEWSRAPELLLDATLDRFDLGRYLEAKRRYQEEQARKAAAAPATAKASPPAAKRPALRSRGTLAVGELAHPNAAVRELRLAWDLDGLSSELGALNGSARLSSAGGRIREVGNMAAQSAVVKILVLPLLVVQKIARLGGARVFPDFNDIELHRLSGDYAFKDGVMTVRESRMDSDAALVSAVGTVDLPRDALDLVVTTQLNKVPPVEVAVTGTIADPKTRVKLGKLLAEPAKQLLEGLLRR